MQEFQTFARGETLDGALLDRTQFFALLGVAIAVAEPGSAPTLMLIDVTWVDATGYAAPADRQIACARAGAITVAAMLSGDGYVGMLRGGRLAVLLASDGRDAELDAAVMACLARPVMRHGVTAIAKAVHGCARWGVDGATAEELFVAADRAMHAGQWQPAARRAHGAGVRFVTSPLQAMARSV